MHLSMDSGQNIVIDRCALHSSFNSSPLVPHICVSKLSKHWSREWLITCSAPSHYMNQCHGWDKLAPWPRQRAAQKGPENVQKDPKTVRNNSQRVVGQFSWFKRHTKSLWPNVHWLVVASCILVPNRTFQGLPGQLSWFKRHMKAL